MSQRPDFPRRAWVFGASGQVGAAVTAELLRAGWQVEALSRGRHAGKPGLRWRQGDFASMPTPAEPCDAVFSCGPLDLFADWYLRHGDDHAAVVAFGSTSLDTKRGAADAGERAVAARLQAAEAGLLEAARARGARATVLRPTLIYGAGRDATLSRIAALARRSGFFLLPRGAAGLRQPVHVADLAAAAIAAVDAPAAAGRRYALPGGETLPYREMVARVLAALDPPPRLIELPAPMFSAALAAARLAGRLHGLPPGAVARMREDLVFDAEPARRDLGYRPRPFRVEAGMFADNGAPRPG